MPTKLASLIEDRAQVILASSKASANATLEMLKKLDIDTGPAQFIVDKVYLDGFVFHWNGVDELSISSFTHTDASKILYYVDLANVGDERILREMQRKLGEALLDIKTMESLS